jgi:hypothetical protein
MRFTLFGYVAPCGLVGRYMRFEVPCCFFLNSITFFYSLKVKEISSETSVNLYRPMTLHDVMYCKVFCTKGKR